MRCSQADKQDPRHPAHARGGHAALRTPEVFEDLVDRLPAHPDKDLLKVWGYVRGIYPRLPDNVPPESISDDASDQDAREDEDDGP